MWVSPEQPVWGHVQGDDQPTIIIDSTPVALMDAMSADPGD
jgi:hypothetical protein